MVENGGLCDFLSFRRVTDETHSGNFDGVIQSNSSRLDAVLADGNRERFLRASILFSRHSSSSADLLLSTGRTAVAAAFSPLSGYNKKALAQQVDAVMQGLRGTRPFRVSLVYSDLIPDAGVEPAFFGL